MEMLYEFSFTSFGLRELMTGACDCCVGVAVGVTGVLVAVGVTGVFVGVGVFVLPGTGVLVAVGLGVLVGVLVAVAVGVPGPVVLVGLGVEVTVGELVGVFVAPPGVLVEVGGVLVAVGVLVVAPDCVGVGVAEGKPPVALSAARPGRYACGVSLLRSKVCRAPAFPSWATLNAAMTSRTPIPRGIPIRRLKCFTVFLRGFV